MKYVAGFIGTGNMGGALASAVYKTNNNIALCDSDSKKASKLNSLLKKATVCDIDELAGNSNFVFLAVKPNVIINVAKGIKDKISKNTIVVTMAAGMPLADISSASGAKKVIRIMPNTPAKVGEGMILYSTAEAITEDDEKEFLSIMKKAGKIDKINEKLFDAPAALTGCGPAFVYMFAQALADGAVSCGVTREKAQLYAAQTLLGSAKMLLESGEHPEKLKDDVCSPGGTTIDGVLTLERAGFRSAVSNAVISAYEKTAKLKK